VACRQRRSSDARPAAVAVAVAAVAEVGNARVGEGSRTPGCVRVLQITVWLSCPYTTLHCGVGTR
jgi:hypothetical protein